MSMFTLDPPPHSPTTTDHEAEEDDFDAPEMFEDFDLALAANDSYTSGSSSDEDDANDATSTPYLFPPYYNRPPTPLPPSPSLTSLLRPAFPTRAATTTSDSDSSEAELSSLFAQRTPRASPRVPTYEYYGFVLYLGGSTAFGMYILWSFLPPVWLHAMGIHYYPDRWWSLAIPAWLVVAICWIYVALAGYNTGYLTRPLGAVEGITDSCSKVASIHGVQNSTTREGDSGRSPAGGKQQVKQNVRRRGARRHSRVDRQIREELMGGEGKDWKALWNVGTDAVMDIPIGGVCEILYGSLRDEEEY
ncbi:PIG-P-domain-containing protein [Ascobolus immersus RN42]|uniref:PIG-P-domain-containing protein n=1 Tax=Ascobolus immersus RN42 TaxID=1160509 RepID=A0A3N4IJA7_ASCIM|nr:PIG-P-domain-containing protein [Ascobolus immersus RN42]